jgi:hypothetical protein
MSNFFWGKNLSEIANAKVDTIEAVWVWDHDRRWTRQIFIRISPRYSIGWFRSFSGSQQIDCGLS